MSRRKRKIYRAGMNSRAMFIKSASGGLPIHHHNYMRSIGKIKIPLFYSIFLLVRLRSSLWFMIPLTIPSFGPSAATKTPGLMWPLVMGPVSRPGTGSEGPGSLNRGFPFGLWPYSPTGVGSHKSKGVSHYLVRPSLHVSNHLDPEGAMIFWHTAVLPHPASQARHPSPGCRERGNSVNVCR